MNDYGKRTELYATLEPWRRSIDLRIVFKEWTPDTQRVSYAQSLTLSPVSDEAVCIPPTLTISTESAQQFMDELWRVGIRPTEGTGSAGSLAATERHLADMRALVFKIDPNAAR